MRAPKRSRQERLEDIVAWGDRVARHIRGITLEEFARREMTLDAVSRCIEVLGEIAARLLEEAPRSRQRIPISTSSPHERCGTGSRTRISTSIPRCSGIRPCLTPRKWSRRQNAPSRSDPRPLRRAASIDRGPLPLRTGCRRRGRCGGRLPRRPSPGGAPSARRGRTPRPGSPGRPRRRHSRCRRRCRGCRGS
jgi:hypothetical protein